MDSTFGATRRTFLKHSGAVLLAGYAAARGTGLAQTVQRPNAEKYQSITLNTHEFFGDIEERFDFPKGWRVDVVGMAGKNAPALTGPQIVQKLRSPINSKPLADIAGGKKTAAISFDDLTCPTPNGIIAEQVINELNAAGIDDDHILFISALGSHHVMTQPEARAKLGAVVDRCRWINHNVFHNFIEVGRTAWMNRVEVDAYFMKADLKIMLTGLRDHGSACYTGGPKSLLPGLSSFQTIFFNYGIVGGYTKGRDGATENGNPTVTRTNLTTNDLRNDIIDAARLAGIDFTVNTVYNGKRQVIEVFAGDAVDAHLQACQYSVKNLCDEREVKTAEYDIVVANSYPGIQTAGTSFIAPREGGSAVVISQNPLGLNPMHYVSESRRLDVKASWDRFYTASAAKFDRLMLSQYMQRRDIASFTGLQLFPAWDTLLAVLEGKFKGAARVCVFPYNGIQHRPKTIA